MGLALSPDRKFIWFTQITGNKIGSLDIESKMISEYPTGDSSGPTLLTFDSKGVLWVTLSYANSILRVEPWLLVPGSKSIGMYSISLERPDFFSPFGVVTAQVKGIEKIFLSDHGSSRLIVSNISSELKNYTSYWTSPSRALPMALPSQVVSDKAGNVFFVEHGGNKIGKISSDNGLMTEFDIPTGPLATSVFLTVSENGKRVWFTEWESNKIGYLDNTVQIPLTMIVRNNESTASSYDMEPIILKQDDSHSVDVTLTLNNNVSSLVLPNATEVSVVGMTDAGLKGIVYSSKPERVNLTAVPEADVKIDLNVESEEVVSGSYTTMIRASFLEKEGLILSLLYPQLIKLDVPNKPLEANKAENFQEFLSENDRSESSGFPFIGLIRTGAIAVVLVLVGYLLYRKVGKRTKSKNRKRLKQITTLGYFTFVNYYALISPLLFEKQNWSAKRVKIAVISPSDEEEERKIL